jgi:ADP-heptose:LPS heptosyltransferase
MKKRILILSHDNKIGDAIVMTGLLKPLHAYWPDCEIGVLAGPSNAALYRNRPEVKWLHISRSRNILTRALASLFARFKRYDIVVHFGLDVSNASTQIILALIHAKKRYLFAAHPKYPLESDVVIDGPWREKLNTSHFSERHVRFLSSLGITNHVYRYDIELPPTPQDQKLEGNSFNLTINSKGSTDDRSLSIDWLSKFLTLLATEFPTFNIFLLSANKSHEKQLLHAFSKILHMVTIAPWNPSVIPTLVIIKNSDILISPDTYAVHAAGAWNIPVIALYADGGKTINSWRPISEAYCQIIAPENEFVNCIAPNIVLNCIKSTLNSPMRTQLFIEKPSPYN